MIMLFVSVSKFMYNLWMCFWAQGGFSLEFQINSILIVYLMFILMASKCVNQKDCDCSPTCTFTDTPKISRNSLIEFTEIAARNKTANKKFTLTFFVALRMRTGRNIPKMENQQLVSQSRQCPNTSAGLGHGYISKEQCTLLSWLQLLFICSLD